MRFQFNDFFGFRVTVNPIRSYARSLRRLQRVAFIRVWLPPPIGRVYSYGVDFSSFFAIFNNLVRTTGIAERTASLLLPSFLSIPVDGLLMVIGFHLQHLQVYISNRGLYAYRNFLRCIQMHLNAFPFTLPFL